MSKSNFPWHQVPANELEQRVNATFPPEDIAAYYDEWNDRYEESFGQVFQHLQVSDPDHFFNHLASSAHLADGERILDAGCGVCGPAIEFARRFAVDIDAVTVSPIQQARARGNIDRAHLGNRVRVSVGDFHRLEDLFQPHTFDLVYFLESLVHSHDPLAALRSAFTVLRPGGRLYIKDFYQGQAEDLEGQRAIDECIAATNQVCHLTIRDFDDVLAWVLAAGFELEMVQPFGAMPYDISAGHRFCEVNGLDVAAGRDFTSTYYLDSHEILARRS